jgi:glutaredoxin
MGWWGWWRSRPVRQVVMYTRRGCHLCDDAWAVLERARRRHRFELTQVDVDGEADLAQRYGTQVPVVLIDGRVRFRGIVNPVLLERVLRAPSDAE